MFRNSTGIRRVALWCWLAAAAALATPHAAQAAEWHAIVGAQSHDKGDQALAFLPNEIWIHQGDSIRWAFKVDEIHTVTFLTSGQVRPPFPAGCPGFSSDPAVFDGSTCVTTPPLVEPDTFTVFFPSTGNFKLVCLVHANMTGVVHVLDANATLPHDQKFYDEQAKREGHDLLHDDDGGGRGGPKRLTAEAPAVPSAPGKPHHAHTVTAGIGEISATPGGTDTLSINRFISADIVIHAGETVEFDNRDPVTPHTITFGDEPAGDPAPPSGNVTVDPDGARHVTISSPSDNAHSGFIVAANQDQIGRPQTPLGVTRFRVTFPNAGTYPYICALHDDLGMKGRVIVVP